MRRRDEGPPERGNPQEPESLAAEVQGGSDEIGRLPSRLDRYANARARALENLAHLRELQTAEDFTRLCSSIQECGEYLAFRNFYTKDQVILSAANFCKVHLLCPLCAIRRGAKSLRAYLERYAVIMQQNPHLGLYLFTATVVNGPDLIERHAHLKNAVRAVLTRRKLALNGNRHKTEWVKVAGLVGSYEVTNIGNGWHPHAHMALLVDKRMNVQTMKNEWKRITGDSHVLRLDPAYNPDNPARDFLEIFKYAVKFSELTPAQNIEAYQALRGKRLLFSAGLFRGVLVPEHLTDELPDEELPYIDMFYRYLDGFYQIEKTREGHQLPSSKARNLDKSNKGPVSINEPWEACS